jgi:hypothetical protein
MSLYAIEQRVWFKPKRCLATVLGASYNGTPRRAHYTVNIGTANVAVLVPAMSADLRAADWCCDGCDRWLPGHPYRSAPDGEYPNGLHFCFLCVNQGD